jgi:hypothetical protein
LRLPRGGGKRIFGKNVAVKFWKFAVFAAGWIALAACSQSNAPAGWHPANGSDTAWTSGSGSAQQSFALVKNSFNGTLQDLASSQAAGVVLKYPGSKFLSSDTYPPCPGLAALAHFSYGKDRAIDQGFAVSNGQAVIVTYIKPKGAKTPPEVDAALQHDLCVPPG